MKDMTWAILGLALVLGVTVAGCGRDPEAPIPVEGDQAGAGSTVPNLPQEEFRSIFAEEEETESSERSPEDGPLIESISFVPDPPVASSPFKAVLTVDNPADGLLDMEFEWFVNGSDVMGVWGDTLPAGKATRGDLVGMSVLVRDVNGKVATERVQGMLVSNATPQIVSRLGSSPRLDGFTFRAEDPDGDRVSWSIEGAPPGVTIHASKGRLSIDSSQVFEEGRYDMEVVATDDQGGEGRMRFGVTLGGSVGATMDEVQVQDARFVAQKEYSDEQYMEQAEQLFERMEGMSAEELEAYLEKSQAAQEDMEPAGATEIPGGDQPTPYTNR